MPELPTGTVKFLFTDIEGSTTRWEHHPDAMRTALARHDALLRSVITAHGGLVFKTKLGFSSRARITAWAVDKGLAQAPQDVEITRQKH